MTFQNSVHIGQGAGPDHQYQPLFLCGCPKPQTRWQAPASKLSGSCIIPYTSNMDRFEKAFGREALKQSWRQAGVKAHNGRGIENGVDTTVSKSDTQKLDTSAQRSKHSILRAAGAGPLSPKARLQTQNGKPVTPCPMCEHVEGDTDLHIIVVRDPLPPKVLEQTAHLEYVRCTIRSIHVFSVKGLFRPHGQNCLSHHRQRKSCTQLR